METIHKQIVEARKKQPHKACKEVKQIYKEFDFTDWIHKGVQIEGRNKQ